MHIFTRTSLQVQEQVENKWSRLRLRLITNSWGQGRERG